MSNSDYENLKKCPFCEDSVVSVFFNENLEMNEEYKVGCGACACQTPAFKTKDQARNFWNTREIIRIENNCPICNFPVEISDFLINPKKLDSKFFQYKCNNCSFQSGISKDKNSIINNWNKTSSKKG